jgi:nucleolar protein 53
MRKIYTKELGPKPVPLIVPGEAITEEDVSFMTEGLYCFFMWR